MVEMAKIWLIVVMFAQLYLKTGYMDPPIFCFETYQKDIKIVFKIKVKKVLHTVFFYCPVYVNYQFRNKIMKISWTIEGILMYIYLYNVTGICYIYLKRS